MKETKSQRFFSRKIIIVENPFIKKVIHKCPDRHRIRESTSRKIKGKITPVCSKCLKPLIIYPIDKDGKMVQDNLRVMEIQDVLKYGELCKKEKQKKKKGETK